jgi:hypothetical protein
MTAPTLALPVIAVLMTLPWQAAVQDPAAISPEVVRRLIEKGGKEWSAPKSAQMVIVRVSAGDRYWIWPQEDRVFDVARSNPKLRLAWRLQPGKPAVTAGEPQRLGMEFIGGSGNRLLGSSSFAFPGGAEGITEGTSGGTFELVGADLPKHMANDGTLVVFMFDNNTTGLATPISNLLRLKVRLVD